MSDLKLTISEYGKEIRTYSDNNKERFVEKSLQIINEHLKQYSHQTREEIKNIQIQVYTIN